MSLSRLILLLPLASACFGFQISLSPANVIGGSGSYQNVAWNSGGFNATHVLDQQTGPVSDIFGTNYWINSDNGPVNAYIVIDLGAQFQISSMVLFNTHNANFDDRGTGNFSFEASNSVTNLGAAGFDLSGSPVTILSGTLTAASTDPIPGQTFAVSNTNTFRYIKFEPHSVAVSGTPCCGSNVYGLNEIRVFSDVPEPSSMALLGSGLIAALATMARRRRR
jgi:hypothetical protein